MSEPERSQSRIGRRIVWGVIVLSFLYLGSVLILGIVGQSKINRVLRSNAPSSYLTVDQINQEITSYLPFGSSKTDVETFLNKQGWAYEFSMDRLFPGNYRTIKAVTPLRQFNSRYMIVFRFDSAEKLLQYSIGPGPGAANSSF